ncbi:GTP-binding protein [Porticoccaceae bacterium]|nr:GTP-binding protein [Porticoccaceae bacterium]
MTTKTTAIKAIPTNIITGFLGVGKTTAILNLLKNKPKNERWAVLVNEFGEIGVDGSLFQGQQSTEQGVFISEVPGGCMCCAAGLPMQIALNQLLNKSKPDRLLIEPTGLGHPKEVLEILSADYYQDVLSLHKTVTLVDARNLTDTRYTDHQTFNQQIEIADLVIGNKLDLYQVDDKSRLTNYVKAHGQADAQTIFCQHGEIPFSALQGLTSGYTKAPHDHHHHHHNQEKPLVSEQPMPEIGFLSAVNQGEGFQSVGWRFAADKVFNYQKLFALLTGINAERMKAVFITNDGVFGYNLTPDALTEIELDDCLESRIELISDKVDVSLEAELLGCLVE